jgi:hypothetical protein
MTPDSASAPPVAPSRDSSSDLPRNGCGYGLLDRNCKSAIRQGFDGRADHDVHDRSAGLHAMAE